MVSKEQKISAFGQDGETGGPTKWNKYPVVLLQLPSTQTSRRHLHFSTQETTHKDFLHDSPFLIPAGTTGHVPPKTLRSPAQLPACQRCPSSSPGSPLHPSTPEKPQACQATSTSQQITHGPHQNSCLPGQAATSKETSSLQPREDPTGELCWLAVLSFQAYRNPLGFGCLWLFWVASSVPR